MHKETSALRSFVIFGKVLENNTYIWYSVMLMTLRVCYSAGRPYLAYIKLLSSLIRSLLCALTAGPSLTLPSSCAGLGGTALPAMQCLAMLRLEQVPFSLAVCFFSSAVSPDHQARPWGSLCRRYFPVSDAVAADLAEG